MFLINVQLWARNRKIPGGGSFNIRGGVNNRGKRLMDNLYGDIGVMVPRFIGLYRDPSDTYYHCRKGIVMENTYSLHCSSFFWFNQFCIKDPKR